MPTGNDPWDPEPFITKRKAQAAEQARANKKPKPKAAKDEKTGQPDEVNDDDS